MSRPKKMTVTAAIAKLRYNDEEAERCYRAALHRWVLRTEKQQALAEADGEKTPEYWMGRRSGFRDALEMLKALEKA